MAEIRAQRQHVATHTASAGRARALKRPDREAVPQVVEADAATRSRPMPQPEPDCEAGKGVRHAVRAWRPTLNSLTAKLTAKSKLLTRMEEDGLVPLRFLTEERKQWKSLKNKPLQRALKYAPIAFLVLGAGAFLGTLALVLPSAAVSQ